MEENTHTCARLIIQVLRRKAKKIRIQSRTAGYAEHEGTQERALAALQATNGRVTLKVDLYNKVYRRLLLI
jgi:hypothetical protein